MARADIDYVTELQSIRKAYVQSAPAQRLSIIRQRVGDKQSGPNRLVTIVSAVEGLARSLVMHSKFPTSSQLMEKYDAFKDRSPKTLVQDYLCCKAQKKPSDFFSQDTWRLFGHAVEYRNLLTHECTYLGQDKFPELIAACEEVLESLVDLAKIR